MTANDFVNIQVPNGTHTEYRNYFMDPNNPHVEPLTIGAPDKYEDNVIALMLEDNPDDPSNPSIVEWFTTSTPMETVVNFCTDAKYFVFSHDPSTSGVVATIIAAALHERSLHSDCFHWSEQTIEALPEAWTNGANPKFTSVLPI